LLVEFVCSSALFLVSKLFNKAHCIDELSRGLVRFCLAFEFF
jgi:hypothetical protein